MLVTIIYNTDYRDAINNARYQIQLDGSVVYSGVNTTDNTTIINNIKERL